MSRAIGAAGRALRRLTARGGKTAEPEPGPRIAIALRTHVWDEAVQLVWDRLAVSRQAEVFLVIDETRGPLATPAGLPKLCYTNDTFREMGLALLPSPDLAMWFNGDYIFYFLAERISFDFLFLVEYDCLVLGDFDAVLDTLAAEHVDYAAKNFGPRPGPFMWRKQVVRWFGNHPSFTIPFGGIFPAVFVSRQAIAALRSARLEMAAAIGTKPDRWVNCEPFCATYLKLNNYTCRALKHYMNARRCTVFDPVPLDEARAIAPTGPQLVHPMLTGTSLARKIAQRDERNARAAAKAAKRAAAEQALAATAG